jgi:hypothetical protein
MSDPFEMNILRFFTGEQTLLEFCIESAAAFLLIFSGHSIIMRH